MVYLYFLLLEEVFHLLKGTIPIKVKTIIDKIVTSEIKGCCVLDIGRYLKSSLVV